jgi:hypothetical protein
MADKQALFDELKKLSPAEAKELSEMLKAQFPKKAAKSEGKADEAPAEAETTSEG